MAQLNESSASDRPGEAIAAAIAANHLAADGRAVRRDGWTAGRIRPFLESLAASASITAAARGAGVSARAAYKFRDRVPAFDQAWQIALNTARPVRPLVSPVLHGRVETLYRDGVVCGERHYFDNRSALATLTGLDRRIQAKQAENGPASFRDFDSLVDLACAEAAAPQWAQSPGDCACCPLSAPRKARENGNIAPDGTAMATLVPESSSAGPAFVESGSAEPNSAESPPTSLPPPAHAHARARSRVGTVNLVYLGPRHAESHRALRRSHEAEQVALLAPRAREGGLNQRAKPPPQAHPSIPSREREGRQSSLGIPTATDSLLPKLKIPLSRLPLRPDGAKRPPSRGCAPQPDPALKERLGPHGS